MITVFSNDERFDVNENTKLGDFLFNEDHGDGCYTVNGEAKSMETILENYNVIEEVDPPNGTQFDAGMWGEDRATPGDLNSPEVVEIELNDFVGHAGRIWIANNTAAVRERYNQPVAIKVIRDGYQLEALPETLVTGDMLIVVPAGGQKGA